MAELYRQGAVVDGERVFVLAVVYQEGKEMNNCRFLKLRIRFTAWMGMRLRCLLNRINDINYNQKALMFDEKKMARVEKKIFGGSNHYAKVIYEKVLARGRQTERGVSIRVFNKGGEGGPRIIISAGSNAKEWGNYIVGIRDARRILKALEDALYMLGESE